MKNDVNMNSVKCAQIKNTSQRSTEISYIYDKTQAKCIQKCEAEKYIPYTFATVDALNFATEDDFSKSRSICEDAGIGAIFDATKKLCVGGTNKNGNCCVREYLNNVPLVKGTQNTCSWLEKCNRATGFCEENPQLFNTCFPRCASDQSCVIRTDSNNEDVLECRDNCESDNDCFTNMCGKLLVHNGSGAKASVCMSLPSSRSQCVDIFKKSNCDAALGNCDCEYNSVSHKCTCNALSNNKGMTLQKVLKISEDAKKNMTIGGVFLATAIVSFIVWRLIRGK